MPWLWTDLFIDPGTAVVFAASYLTIVGPFYGFFAGGMSLYFASQGTGKMIFPVLVNITRLLVVSIICTLVVLFQLEIKWLFCGVSIGLLVTGIGQFLCVPYSLLEEAYLIYGSVLSSLLDHISIQLIKHPRFST